MLSSFFQITISANILAKVYPLTRPGSPNTILRILCCAAVLISSGPAVAIILGLSKGIRSSIGFGAGFQPGAASARQGISCVLCGFPGWILSGIGIIRSAKNLTSPSEKG
jgi:hypothetical protein